MVGPGALKPTVGNGIESRRPLLHQFYFLSFFPSFHICICIGVYIIIIIIIIIITTTTQARSSWFLSHKDWKPTNSSAEKLLMVFADQSFQRTVKVKRTPFLPPLVTSATARDCV